MQEMFSKSNQIIKKYAFFVAILLYGFVFSQTPGLIIRDGAGNMPPLTKSAVLDPNKDGYVSASTTGFTTTDLGLSSEILYNPLALTYLEPSGDLSRGPNGSFSDLVPDANGRSFYSFSDGTNIYFRLRIGNFSTGSYGYSALIDADGKFGLEDPTYSSTNPGYEYEVSVQTGFKISVYDVDSGNACTEIWTKNLATNPQYVQTALAYTTNNGNPDYFIDFYVPYSAFSGSKTIDANTPMRFQPGTVMAPDTALCGPTSDSYPINNVAQQPACTPAQIADGTCSPFPCSNPPTIDLPLAAGATVIKGTWSKAIYSTANTATIKVYKNDVLLGTTTASSGGTWSFSTYALATNDVVYAKAVTSDATDCYKSNEVRVITSTCTIASPASILCINTKKITITNVPANNTITIYKVGVVAPVATIVTTSLTNVVYTDTGVTSNSDNSCSSGNTLLSNGSYYFTQVDSATGCSYTSNVQSNCSTSTITMTTTTINSNTKAINFTTSVSAAIGTEFVLYRNATPVSTIKTTVAGTSFSFNTSTLSILEGDKYQIAGVGCFTSSAIVTAIAAPCNIIPPIINNSSGNIAAGKSISGTSGYIGSVITVKNNTGDTLIGTTTVDSNGKWSLATPVAVSGTSYYSTVTTACGVSAKSNVVSTLAVTNSGRCGVLVSPVNDNATSVSGTLSSAVATTTVYLYIDGFLIGQTTTNTTSWSIPVNTTNNNKIYGGGVLSIGIKENSNAEVACTANTVNVTLTCSLPSSPVVSPTSYSIVEGATKNINVTNTLTGVLYTLENPSGKDYSPSYFGNGGTITIATNPITANDGNNFKITAVNLSSTSCIAETALTITVQNDTDDDGVAEEIDLDDDNDGILDAIENNCDSSINKIEISPAYSNDFGTGSPVADANVIGHTFDATDPAEGFYAVTKSSDQTLDYTKTDLTGNKDAGNPTINNGTVTGRYLMINVNSASFNNLPIYKVTNISTKINQNYRFRIDISGLTNGNLTNIPIIKISVKDASNNEIASVNSSNLGIANDDIWRRLALDFKATTSTVNIEIINQQTIGGSGNEVGIDNIILAPIYCDLDNDGTPNQFDLDSDNDGCPDAVEGDENVSTSQLTAGRISGTVNSNGVPNLVNAGGAADIGSDEGQGVGEAYNAALQSGCFCYKPPQKTGNTLDSVIGITSLHRVIGLSDNWPMVRKGAWLVLESKNKGFVISRLTQSEINAIPTADLREGMIVYNVSLDCIQVNTDGTAAGWKTFGTQACPD